MRRTSLKAFSLSIGFLSFGLFSMSAAEAYYESTNPIKFGLDFGRPWNHWDYLWLGSFVMFFALLVVSLMFLNKDD